MNSSTSSLFISVLNPPKVETVTQCSSNFNWEETLTATFEDGIRLQIVELVLSHQGRNVFPIYTDLLNSIEVDGIADGQTREVSVQ